MPIPLLAKAYDRNFKYAISINQWALHCGLVFITNNSENYGLMVALLCLFWCDWLHRLLPHRYLLLFLFSNLTNLHLSYLPILTFLFFYGLSLTKQLGLGDVKLLTAFSLFCDLMTLNYIILIGCLLALAKNIIKRDALIPFGSYLIVAYWLIIPIG